MRDHAVPGPPGPFAGQRKVPMPGNTGPVDLHAKTDIREGPIVNAQAAHHVGHLESLYPSVDDEPRPSPPARPQARPAALPPPYSGPGRSGSELMNAQTPPCASSWRQQEGRHLIPDVRASPPCSVLRKEQHPRSVQAHSGRPEIGAHGPAIRRAVDSPSVTPTTVTLVDAHLVGQGAPPSRPSAPPATTRAAPPNGSSQLPPTASWPLQTQAPSPPAYTPYSPNLARSTER